MWDAEVSEWEKALKAYPQVVKAYEASSEKLSGLGDLEIFIWEELGKSIRARNVKFLEHEEYSRVVKWKLKRGKWRPRLQKFADQLGANVIKEQSQIAFETLNNGDTRGAIAQLSKLRGCGPATASAVLAAFDDSVPFMSDELLGSIPRFNGKRDYTLPVYMTLVNEVQKKVSELCDTGGKWSARDLERAVFASVLSDKLGIDLEASPQTVDPEIEGRKTGSEQTASEKEVIADNQSAVGNKAEKSTRVRELSPRSGTKRKTARENPSIRKSARLQRN